ncbi:MAG: amidohydrolase [Acidobacteria bacterium]|nr:amidohydrolase [Acidobacteriota bacterium]
MRLALPLLFIASAALSAAASPELDARIAKAAAALHDKLVAQRRDFHVHPELSNREVRTSKVIAERLRALGLEDIRTGIAHHGVTALLRGAKPGPVIAVRADMDALPILETLDVPYKSQNAGVKHACGHDLHVTVQLGVAELLAAMRNDIAGTIKFIFQPAEESPPVGEEGGASMMVRQGVLESPRPREIFGLHVTHELQVGTFGWTPGGAMASGDRFTIKIKGKKVHGAWPHQGIDANVVAAESILALQSIRSRRIDPSEPMVLTIGSIHGGNRFNIITDEVTMEGTVRTLDEDVRGKVHGLMREILGGITKAHGASYELDFTMGYPVTFNEPALAERSAPTLTRLFGTKNVKRVKPSMGSEDFSEYQKVIPGFFYWLGVGNFQKGINGAVHTPEFDADEDALVLGVRAMTSILLDALAR